MHHALRRAAARRATVADTYMRSRANKTLTTASQLASVRQRKGYLTDLSYAKAIADIHDTRRMVRVAVQDEMRRMVGAAS